MPQSQHPTMEVPMISERTLRRWRQDALGDLASKFKWGDGTISLEASDAHTLLRIATECNQRILRLTQELMDQHLMTKGR